MAAQTKVKSSTQKMNSTITNAHNTFTTKPAKSFGIVNIDNISDREFEIITEIADATVKRLVSWKSHGFLNLVTDLVTRKDLSISYKGSYKNYKIFIKDDIKGKTYIKITQGITRRVIVDTFIPFKPVIKNGTRIGTKRSLVLYNLYKAARYQVDGDLLAS